MIESNKRIVLVSASPKVDQDWAVSAFLAKRGEALLQNEEIEVITIPVRHALMHHETTQAFELLQQADALVLIFPLYFFCLPGMLTRFLQDFAANYPKAETNAPVYAIVNCGFPEPEINLEAMRVVEQFAIQTGREFGGGVMIGCGGMVIVAKDAPFMRETFAQIDRLFVQIKENMMDQNQIHPMISLVAPKFPRQLYFIGGNAGWHSMARKNHVKQRDLYRKPYQR